MERYSDIEEDFPRLRSGNYTPTSKPDPAYNCVAWAVGDLNNFWDDVGVVGYYWPAGVSSDTVSGWIEVFRIHGYIETDDYSLSPEHEKVAIYVSDDGSPQHVTRQKASGRWTSKLGRGRDIEHDLNALEGELYGKMAIIMRRPCAGKRVLE
jgi:hypothetical protein